MCRKTYFFLALLLGFVSILDAQVVEPCGASILQSHSLANHPELLHKRETTEQLIQDFEQNGVNNREVFTVPIVFHIVYYSDVENVSDQQVFSQIAALNRDYRKRNENFSKVHEDFKKVAADVEIEFCLTEKDPFGNETTGITRTQTPYANIGHRLNPSDGRPAIYYSNLGGENAWDTQKYLNIWVCNIGGSILGSATFPGTVIPEEDGIIIDYEAFGSVGTAKYPNNRGKTLAHEIGHYFDLQHIWGNKAGDCAIDDGIDDTPFQERPTQGCPSDRRVSCGSFDMYKDYMDYSADECLAMFTQGQKTRMLATLQTVRKELLNSNTCNKTTFDAPLEQIVLYTNPVDDELFVSLKGGNIFEASVTIYDVLGHVMLKEKTFFFPGAYPIDVHFYPQGVYFVVLSSSDNQLVRKLVVNH